ncbi:type I polyketide synthase [Streptacidiphilus sp. N1-3]|uniref:Type I polyketide synthase n=1 Tax=Streptacidiphilus alkalitolerans TaxID=3342712 RepID=A0ABV6WZ66_9ACTN
MDAEGAVAVVGLACRYPGAEDASGYWAMLRDGVEGITRFDPSRLTSAGVDPQLVARDDYVAARGVLAGARDFDWPLFGYSRAEAATIDPQQRVFLECAFAALDDAGIDPARFPGWIGVYAGADGPGPGRHDQLDPLTRIIGNHQDFLTSRAAYKLGLRGPAVTVQTACSTSLTAVHLAMQSLLGHESDAVLAGGVSVAPPGEWGYLYQEGGILSPDGHCRPFDAEAAGTVPAEGVGVVVLKRLPDALAAGDRIAAVIRGSALNNDGSDKIGYTAPSISGQREVIRLAQEVAGVDPADIGYVEAHGTGTRLGDPVELQALTDAFGSAAAPGSCWIGAVKGNIGHTGAAAGVAGLIKTVLMLEHGALVPTLHFRTPNPLLRIDSTPFRVSAAHRPWPSRGTRLAAVSSFGVGGTNAHLVLSDAPPRTGSAPDRRDGRARVFALSGASPEMLARHRQDLADHLGTEQGPGADAVCRTLAGRRRLDLRQAVVAATSEEAARLLRAAGDPPEGRRLDRVAFLLPGQGTLTHPAGAAAYRLLPGFRKAFDEIAGAASGPDLTPVVSADGTPPDWFADTVHQQLGLFALGYALGRQLLDWGIRPTALLGNSIGEYAAAALAGLWTPDRAVALVQRRAAAMGATGPGSMVVVDTDAAQLARLVPAGAEVSIAVAGPGRTVLSSSAAGIAGILADPAVAALSVRQLDVRHAFHSELMAPAVGAVRQAAAGAPTQVPTMPMVSTVTGGWAAPEELRSADYWADQLRRTVRLDDAFGTLLGADCDTFLELGPGTSMVGAGRRHRDWHPGLATVPMLGRPEEDGERALLRAVASLWELGADLDPDLLTGTERPVRCALPGRRPDPRDPDALPAPAQQPTPSTDAPPPSGMPSVRDAVAALWCRALGVPAVADQDDFFALGGESLMAVQFISRVRAETGSAVAVAEFTVAPTFGRLVGLVEPIGLVGPQAKTAARDIPGVVRLRQGDSGRPLFLAADARGSASSYRVLAELLDTGRPVIGLEPVGSHRGIAELARSHVDTLLQVQPDGPYTIGGWSFGAAVAHEMAVQLTARGATVDHLVLLDGYVPDRRGRLGFLAANARLQAEVALGVGRVGRPLRADPAARRTFVAGIGALLRYRVRPVPCPMALFVAGPGTAARLTRDLGALYRDVQVTEVDGDHWSMLVRPHAGDLAGKVGALLRATPIPTGR